MTRNEMIKGRLSVSNLSYFDIIKDPEPNVSKENPLLNLIFAKDERGCHVGDISQFMSDKTNPEVKLFIQQQLMNSNSSEKGLSLNTEQVNKLRKVISDDDIARFSRNHGESPEQYAMRIGKFFSDEKAKNAAQALFNREKARLEKLGFNFDD